MTTLAELVSELGAKKDTWQAWEHLVTLLSNPVEDEPDHMELPGMPGVMAVVMQERTKAKEEHDELAAIEFDIEEEEDE